MKILIIDNGTKHLGKLKNLLFNNELTVSGFLRFYPSLEKFDLIILSGGSQLSIESAPEVFREEIDLIKKTNKPLIGICEGCEIIAYSYGSKLEFQQRKSLGLRKIEFLKDGRLFEGLANPEVYEAHHWAITKLGRDLFGLARSRSGYEIIKHKNKKIFGLQFHPEMLKNESVGNEIFQRILIKLTGETKFQVD